MLVRLTPYRNGGYQVTYNLRVFWTMGDLTPNDRLKLFAKFKPGQHAVRGPTGYECTDLIQAALKEAKAKNLDDYNQPDSRDYVWGNRISDLKDVQPGDIIQFRLYHYRLSSLSRVDDVIRGPEHTALITEVKIPGLLVQIIEQHIAPQERKIVSSEIFLRSAQFVRDGMHYNVVIDGDIWVYRAQKK